MAEEAEVSAPQQTSTREDAVRSLFRPAVRVLGSTTAAATFLLLFGYLSLTALHGMAGLPLLSMDTQVLVEAGAGAIVDSVGSALHGAPRLTLVVVSVLAALFLWLAQDRAGVKRFLASPRLCLATQLVLLVLLTSFVSALIDVAKHASPRNREEFAARAQKALEQLPEEDRNRPPKQFEAIWRTTYELPSRNVWSVLNWLASERGVSRAKPAGSMDSDSDGGQIVAANALEVVESGSTYGETLRRSALARRRAEDLYGWVFLSAIGLVLLFAAVRQWRVRLESNPPAGEAVVLTPGTLPPPEKSGEPPLSGQSAEVVTATPPPAVPAARPVLFVRAGRLLVEPLLGASAVLMLALVPLAHGVLAHSEIGREEVVVRLRVGGPNDGKRDGCGIPSRDQTALRCEAAVAEELETHVTPYSRALLRMVQVRSDEAELQPRTRDFRRATDQLIDFALTSDCLGVWQEVWLLRPHSAVFSRAPAAAQYFWDRWSEALASKGTVRFGHILNYPRGTAQDRLQLFESIVDPAPGQEGRWALQEIPRSCIEETIVVPDLVRAHLEVATDRVLSRSQDAFSDLTLYLNPAAFRRLVEIFKRDVALFPARGALITAVGTLTGVFAAYEPKAAEESVEILAAILGSDSAPSVHRGAAATALYLAGGTYAAEGLASGLARIDQGDWIAELGTSITAAGFLARDLQRAKATAEMDGGPGQAPETSRALLDFLARVAKDHPGVERATACTSLRRTLDPLAREALLSTTVLAISTQDLAAIGPCVSALGSANIEAGRPILQEIIIGKYLWVPDQVKGAAIETLYELGFSKGDELVDLYRSVSGELVAKLGTYLEDGPSSEVGPELLRCASEAVNDPALRWRCFYGLTLIDDDEDGDVFVEGLLHAMGEWEPGDMTWDVACGVLWEFSKRGSYVADFAAPRLECPPAPELEAGRARWSKYLRLLLQSKGEPFSLLRALRPSPQAGSEARENGDRG